MYARSKHKICETNRVSALLYYMKTYVGFIRHYDISPPIYRWAIKIAVTQSRRECSQNDPTDPMRKHRARIFEL